MAQADGDAVATSASGIPEAWTVRDIGPAALEQLRRWQFVCRGIRCGDILRESR